MNGRVIQLAMIAALLFSASAPARANVMYRGGRVLPAVRIIPIFYGNSWTASEIASTKTYLDELASYVRGAKNPAGKQTLYAQYGVTAAQVDQLSQCPGCADSNPRVLSGTVVTDIIHAIQQANNNFYNPDEVFLLLPGPGYSTGLGGPCGFRGKEGDGRYYAAVPRTCSNFKHTISIMVMDTATQPNNDGWGAIAPCSSHTWNFGNGEIALPWNNHLGGCPAFSTDPNTPFDTKQGEVLQVLMTSQAGGLYHTLRYPTSWAPWGDVKAAIGSNPGDMGEVEAQATLGVFNHVVASTNDGRLWHTIRTDSGWTPWVDVNAATGAGAVQFRRVGLANVNGDLHVCATNDTARPRHAIRYQDGSWTGFGDVFAQTGQPPDFVEQIIDLDCAGIGSEMHMVMTMISGRVFHTIRSESGWTSLRDVEGEAGNLPNPPSESDSVTVALFASDLHVTVTMAGTQYHTTRHNAGSWTPFTTPPNSIPLPWDNSSAGAQDYLHLVSIPPSGIVQHRTRDSLNNWSPYGDVFAQSGNPGLARHVSAASSLGY